MFQAQPRALFYTIVSHSRTSFNCKANTPQLSKETFCKLSMRDNNSRNSNSYAAWIMLCDLKIYIFFTQKNAPEVFSSAFCIRLSALVAEAGFEPTTFGL